MWSAPETFVITIIKDKTPVERPCINNSHFYIHQAALSLKNRIPDCPRRVVPEKRRHYTLDSALHMPTSTEAMDTAIIQLTFFF